MADEEESGAEEGKGGGGKKIILLVIIGLLLVGVSVGGTIFALKMMAPEEPPAEAAEGGEGGEGGGEGGAAAAEEVKAPAIYFPLKPTLIVNYNARGKQRFLQAEISLMVREEDVVAAVEEHNAMLQHHLLMLFSGQDYSELQTAEGKELLRQQALAQLQGLMEKEIGKPGIEQVLFTNFVMQ